jgi:hypothetical protein
MNPKIIAAIKHYLYGLLASSWNGGVGAVAGILGIDTVAVATNAANTHILSGKEMLSAFAGAFVLHAFMWLRKNPLPETLDSDAPFPQPKDP